MNLREEREGLYCWLNKDKIKMGKEMDYKDKLRTKKLKLKLEYLQLELEETQMIFHDSLVIFK